MLAKNEINAVRAQECLDPFLASFITILSQQQCLRCDGSLLFSADSCHSTPGGWPCTKLGVRRRIIAAVVAVHFQCNSMDN
jgi:hypothetical protein